MGDVLVHCRDVSHRYGRATVVDRVGLSVSRGEVVGLLGANGAGKTTLIRILLGLQTQTSGEVSLFGSRPSRRTRKLLGYVPQSLGLYDDLTASENLDFARAAFGGPAAVIPPNLRDWDGVPVGRLPLGIQRRLSLVQALAHRPQLLVLDEPTSGVGALARSRLWEIIRTVADSGTGVLVTTHSMEEAEECDRLVVLAAGRLVAEGPVNEIVGDSQVVAVYTGDWIAAFAALDRADLKASLAGRSLRVPSASRAQVAAVLQGLRAQLSLVPATLAERFVELSATRTDE